MDRKSRRRVIVDVDFNDEIYLRPAPMRSEEIAGLVDAIADNGADTLVLRVGFLGILPYRTNLGYYPPFFDEEDARKNPPSQFLGSQEKLDDWLETRKAWMSRYVDVLKDYNPPEVFIEHARRRNMEIFFWIDIFDDWYPGYLSKFLDENQHCQWTARDGKTYFRGLTSYAWEESRGFRIRQVKELLALGADGILCSTSAHCRHLPINSRTNDFFGFEQPVVDEYKKQFGIDIRINETFDYEAWHAIKGDFMVQLYRELAELCHGQGKKLWIGLQLGEHTVMSAPYFSDNAVARYSNHWKKLVDEKIADAFILGDYEIVNLPGHDYWKMKGLGNVPDLYAWAAQEYLSYCQGRCECFLFSQWLSNVNVEAELCEFGNLVGRHGFDGIDVHEACNLEPDKFGALKKMASLF